MKAEQVANIQLREMVQKFERDGLPKAVPLDQGMGGLDDKQMDLLRELHRISEKEKAIAEDGQEPKTGTEWWRIREETRVKLQEAVLLDLIHLGLIQRQAIGYGAIPDPQEKWKYFKLPDGSFACWKCGTDILVKEVSFSVHFKEMPLAGSGEVRRKMVPYCPNCESEPSDHGFIQESLAESVKNIF
jgi:hypothetical protein